MDELAAGRAAETAQPADGVTYAEKITKAEALIDWREEAEQIARKVRAFFPTPIAETRWNGEQLRIWEARALPASGPAGGRNRARARCCKPRPAASTWRAGAARCASAGSSSRAASR